MNEKLINKLEDQGEKVTRSKLAQGVYASSKKPIIENWLEEQNRKEAFKISKESLKCSKQANNTAKKANIISIIALIASFIISVVAVIRS